MTNCTQESFQFPACQRRVVEASFQGGDITSDGGVFLLQQADRRLGLTAAIAQVLQDPRRRASCDHDLLSLLRQRVYGLALGYEDLNDHADLRRDLTIQTAVGRDQELASAATLCRWENRADRQAAWQMHEVLVDRFIASFRRPPKKLFPARRHRLRSLAAIALGTPVPLHHTPASVGEAMVAVCRRQEAAIDRR